MGNGKDERGGRVKEGRGKSGKQPDIIEKLGNEVFQFGLSNDKKGKPKARERERERSHSKGYFCM